MGLWHQPGLFEGVGHLLAGEVRLANPGKAINRFAHFRANVDGLNIHFIHERGKGPKPLLLLLLHGWPSSFFQMLKILPLLTDPTSDGGDPADSFDVIVASLPGYGFSDRPTRPGMSVGRMADLFAKLMTDELGYDRYAARGTDIAWASSCSSQPTIRTRSSASTRGHDAVGP